MAVIVRPTQQRVVVRTGVLTASSGGGGTTDHAALASNLAWTTSGHTGTSGGGVHLAGFDALGAASEVAASANVVSLLGAADYSAIRTQLSLVVGVNVQAHDASLTSLAALGTAADRYAYTTGVDTWAEGTITAAGRAILDDADATAQRATLGLVIGANVQAYDAGLLSLAALPTAADRYAYSTGADTWAEGTITAAGRAILDDADATAQRVTLGLVIGANVQAYDVELAAIAGLTSAADSLPYFTGSGSASLTTLTATGRSILDDASVAAVRTTLDVDAKWSTTTDATTSRTITSADHHTLIRFTSASAITVTFPDRATNVGLDVILAQDGTGTITVNKTTAGDRFFGIWSSAAGTEDTTYAMVQSESARFRLDSSYIRYLG